MVAITSFIFVAKKLFSFVCWENLKLYFWFIQWRRETYKYSWFEQVPTENIDKSIDYGANKHFVIFTFPRFAGHICIWIFDILMVFTGLGPAGAANQIIDRDKGPMRSQTEIRSYGASVLQLRHLPWLSAFKWNFPCPVDSLGSCRQKVLITRVKI